MARPLMLDVYCGVGGAGQGYQRAGFDVVGVDVHAQPDYPFPFFQLDALEALADPGRIGDPWGLGRPFVLYAASPPCQADCNLTAGTNAVRHGGTHRSMLAATRDRLDALGRPYVIEQPVGRAVMRRDLTLCGEMFGLDVIRHRAFEISGFTVPSPPHRKHRGRVSGWRHGVYHPGPYAAVYGEGGGKGTVSRWQQAMGIDWTDNRRSIAEAIPPAYTEHIGRHLRALARRVLLTARTVPMGQPPAGSFTPSCRSG